MARTALESAHKKGKITGNLFVNCLNDAQDWLCWKNFTNLVLDTVTHISFIWHLNDGFTESHI